MPSASTPTFTVRHVQIARALFAALAAVMITFSGDHSASLGLSVFSGFAIATGLVWGLSAWLVYPQGVRIGAILMALVSLVAGMVAGIPPLRNTTMFFIVIISWAALSGIIELVWGVKQRRQERVEDRDAITIGIISLVLAVGTAIVPAQYQLAYTVDQRDFTLTGTIIAVGVFGAYAAIVAVFLAIAAFSPKQTQDVADSEEVVTAERES